MESIINEDRPIYDAEVAKVFGFRPVINKDFETKLTIYLSRLQIIKETYDDIIKKDLLSSIVSLFYERFKSNNISAIKILDFIFWSTGKHLNKNLKTHAV